MFDAGIQVTDKNVIDDIALAMGLWAFPAQDDVDFALPTYDV